MAFIKTMHSQVAHEAEFDETATKRVGLLEMMFDKKEKELAGDARATSTTSRRSAIGIRVSVAAATSRLA